MKGIVEEIKHTSKVLRGINHFIGVKAVVVKSPQEIHLHPEIIKLGSGPRLHGHLNAMQNFYLYARIKLRMPETDILTVSDIETGLPLAHIEKGVVTWAS